jgi:hypothetical protein
MGRVELERGGRKRERGSVMLLLGDKICCARDQVVCRESIFGNAISSCDTLLLALSHLCHHFLQ